MRHAVLVWLTLAVLAASQVKGDICDDKCPSSYRECKGQLRASDFVGRPRLLRTGRLCCQPVAREGCECTFAGGYDRDGEMWSECMNTAKAHRADFVREADITQEAVVVEHYRGNERVPDHVDRPLTAAVVGGGPVGLITALQLRTAGGNIPVTVYEARLNVNRDGEFNPANARTQTIVLRDDVAKILLGIPFPTRWPQPPLGAVSRCNEIIGSWKHVREYWYNNHDIMAPTLLHAIICLDHRVADNGPLLGHPGLLLGATAFQLGTVSMFAFQEVLYRFAEGHGVSVQQKMAVTEVEERTNPRTGTTRIVLEIDRLEDDRGRQVAGKERAVHDIVVGAEGLPGGPQGKSVLAFLMEKAGKKPAHPWAVDWPQSEREATDSIYAATHSFLVPRSTRQPNSLGLSRDFFGSENALFSARNPTWPLPSGQEGTYTQRVFRSPYPADDQLDIIYCGVGMSGEVFREYLRDKTGFMKKTVAVALSNSLGDAGGERDIRDGMDLIKEFPADFTKTQSDFPMSLHHAAAAPLYVNVDKRLLVFSAGDVALEPLFILASGMNTGQQLAAAGVRVAAALAGAPNALDEAVDKYLQVFNLLASEKQTGARKCMAEIQAMGSMRACHNPPTDARSFFLDGTEELTGHRFPTFKASPGHADPNQSNGVDPTRVGIAIVQNVRNLVKGGTNFQDARDAMFLVTQVSSADGPTMDPASATYAMGLLVSTITDNAEWQKKGGGGDIWRAWVNYISTKPISREVWELFPTFVKRYNQAGDESGVRTQGGFYAGFERDNGVV